MTTRRLRNRTPFTLGLFEIIHLTEGDCLCDCSLCDPRDSPHRNVFRFEDAKRVWTLHRAPILATYTRWLEERGEPGLLFPVFAEIVFEGKKLPPLNPKWPYRVQQRHRSIEDGLALRALQSGMV